MAPWDPSKPWPGSEGGASSPYWGGYVRLWIRAALEAGRPFTAGPHANDRLDDGNVLAGGEAMRAELVPTTLDAELYEELGTLDVPETHAPVDRLWHDLSCDVLDVEIAGGSTSSQGIFSQADAATCVVTLADPLGIYDPIVPGGPFAYGGRSRLVPGTPVEVWAEVVNGDDGTITTHWIFTGTADSWGEDWTPNPRERQAKLVATDETKRFIRYDRPEAAPVGANEKTGARVQRIVTYFDWRGPIIAPASGGTVTLQETTLSDNAWEQLRKTLDDELGYIHVTSTGALRWLDRNVWTTLPDPVLVLGCDDLDPAYRDVLLDVSPSTLDRQMRNEIYAQREGGAVTTTSSASSIARFGAYDYKRTDLRLATDAQVHDWANLVLQFYAYPQIGLEDATIRPAIDARSWEVWNSALELQYVSDLVRIVWAPPDLPDRVIDMRSRVVGQTHKITRRSWEMKLQLIDAIALAFAGAVFTAGPHANDRLDAGFVLGFG
jgi:hypothetical protein